jgi:NADH-quinone oxidoreductase subunit M
MLGQPAEGSDTIVDLSVKEAIPLVPVVLMILWIGIFPGFFLKLAEPAVQTILNLMH